VVTDYDFSTGKLDPLLLEALIGRLPTADERLVVGPGVGEDAAVIDFGDRYLVAKTDPITFATDRIGWYAVHINANDIATMGATPKWFLAAVLLPEGATDLALVESVFQGVADACRSLGITLAGGHTEITHDLRRPILVGQMLGEVAKDRLVTTAGAQVGDVVLLTKGIAVEGTALIAQEREAILLERGYAPPFLQRARDYLTDPGISIVRDAQAACGAGRIHSMHDPTEGGLATGLHEIAAAAGVGLQIESEAIPVLPESARLCAEFGLDPLGTLGSGALVLTCSPDEADRVRRGMHSAGIACAQIGVVTPPEAGVRLVRRGEAAPLQMFVKDEITKLF